MAIIAPIPRRSRVHDEQIGLKNLKRQVRFAFDGKNCIETGTDTAATTVASAGTPGIESVISVDCLSCRRGER